MEQDVKLEYKLRTANEFAEEGKSLHAIQLYNAIIDEYPEHPQAYYSAAGLYERLGMIQPAVNLLQTFLSENPEDKDCRLFLSQLLLRSGRWEQSIEFLEFIEPEEEPVAAFFMGYSYFMLKDYKRSKINFLNFIKVEKQTELLHEAHIYLAKIEIYLNNIESALNYAHKAEVIYSNYWELNLIFALSYFKLGMYAHAVNSVQKALQLSPLEPAPYECAGQIYFKLDDYEKAEYFFLKYVEMIEDASPDTYAKLAESCMKISKVKDALNYFDVALKLDPGNISAKEGKIKATDRLNEIINAPKERRI